MSESDLKLLESQFERLQIECDTPAKATAQLQSEGLLDANGHTAELYRDTNG